MSLSLRVAWPGIIQRELAKETGATLTFWDQAALWASLACGLTALAPGAFLVPANSLEGAVAAAGLGALLAAGLMAIAASSGARDRGDLGEFLRAALGPAPGRLAALLLVARNVVWLAFLLALMADGAAHLLGTPPSSAVRAAAASGIGLAALGFAAAGPHLLLPLLVKRLLAPAAIATIVIVALSSFLEMGVPELLRREAVGGWPNVAQGADLIALGALAWLPAAAGISRYSHGRSEALSAAFYGFGPPTFLLALVGAIYLPAVAGSESWELLTAVPLAVLALLMLLTLETDGLVVLAYASAEPVEDRRRRLASMGLVCLVAVALAANFNAADLEGLAFAAGLLFLPPVVLHWLCGKRAAASSRRPALVAAWCAGFVAAVWFYPGLTGPLRESVDLIAGGLGLASPLTDRMPLFGAILPGVLVTALTYAALSPFGRREARQ